MEKQLSIKIPNLLCGIVFLLELLSCQSNRMFGISEGPFNLLLYYSKYVASAFLIIYAFSHKRKISNYKVKQMISAFIPLVALMVITELVTFFTDPISVELYGLKYWTRSLFIFLDSLCKYAVIISIWAILGVKAIDCISSILLFDELLLLISGVINNGFSNTFQTLISALTFTNFTSNYFEVHEVTFDIGLCIIYYLFFEEHKQRHIGCLILLIICFILGSKRIAFFGIVVASIVALLVHKKGLSQKSLICIGMVGVIVCFAYISALYNNEFFLWLDEHEINSMGRNLLYPYFTRRTEFSASQTGWGIAGVSKIIENMDKNEVYNMVNAEGLHNDILKIYINYGFFGSLAWYAINLIYFPVKLFKNFSMKTAVIYIVLACYMFITYLTDNTESYFTCQITFLLIPLAAYCGEISDKKNIVRSNEKMHLSHMLVND